MSEEYDVRAHKQIKIESWSNSARVILLRGHATEGPFAEQHTTNADRSLATDTFELHGIPKSLVITPLVAGVQRGACYIRATLMMDGEPVKVLAAGYLTDSKTISWPPGQIEGFTDGPGLLVTVAGTNPAANAEISEAIPTNTRRRLLAITFNLMTDANVADREVALWLDDGASMKWLALANYDHTASLTRRYSAAKGVPLQAGGSEATERVIPIPDIPLGAGWRIRTTLTNKQAGDDYGAPSMLFEEWIEE